MTIRDLALKYLSEEKAAIAVAVGIESWEDDWSDWFKLRVIYAQNRILMGSLAAASVSEYRRTLPLL